MFKVKLTILLTLLFYLLLNNFNTLYGQDSWEKNIDSLKQVIEIDPEDDVAYLNLGNAYYKLERYPEAIESFKQGIRIDPEVTGAALAHYSLGVLYLYINNDRGSALEQYKILKDLNKDLANKLFNAIYE